jgi:hypothetical protein
LGVGVRWWRTIPGGVLALTGLVILLSRWSAIVGSHPAYLVVLISMVVLGAGLLASGATAGRDRSDGEGPGVRRRWRTVVARVLGVLATVALLATVFYLRPIPATDAAAARAADPGAAVEVTTSWDQVTLEPTAEAPTTGLVFFPGALVEPIAYVPNLLEVAAAGYLVVIIKPPLNVALLARGRATDVFEADPSIERWVVGGHSLGGVAAASVAGSSDEVDGLLLWASFPNGSIADREDLEVTSISGSEDGLSTPADIDATAPRLPEDTEYVEIDGANHAQFGDYGAQSGDGEATIDPQDASEQIVDASLALLQRVDAAS